MAMVTMVMSAVSSQQPVLDSNNNSGEKQHGQVRGPKINRSLRTNNIFGMLFR